MEERRIERVGESMKTFAEVDRQVLPIVGKCLDGMTKGAESIEPKHVSGVLVKALIQHSQMGSHNTEVHVTGLPTVLIRI